MADSYKSVKLTTAFAADMVPGGRKIMYGKSSPTDILQAMISFKDGSMDWTKEDNEYFFSHFTPDGVVGMNVGSDNVRFKRYGREDFASKGPMGTGLLQILVNDSIVEGIGGAGKLRNIVRVINMSSPLMEFPFWTERKRLEPKASLAEFPDLSQTIVKSDLKAQRYGATAALDKDLIASTSGKLVAEAHREIGGAIGLTLEVEILEALIKYANKSASAVTASKEDATKGLMAAKALIGRAGMSPAAAGISYDFDAQITNSIPLYTETAISVALKGEGLPMYGGLELAVSGADPDLSGVKWKWQDPGDIGAVVIDPTRAPALGIFAEISTDEYDNVLKFALNPVGSMSFGIASPPDRATKGGLGAAIVKMA